MARLARKAKTIFAMPNPYCHLDHDGMLAGACQQAEEPRPGSAMPLDRKVGASLKVLEGSQEKAQPGSGLNDRADFAFEFSSEPVAIAASPALMGFYVSRDAKGDLFLCKDGSKDSVPMARLAEARAAAIARHVAAYGDEPPVADWPKQFALDAQVAAHGKPKPAAKKES